MRGAARGSGAGPGRAGRAGRLPAAREREGKAAPGAGPGRAGRAGGGCGDTRGAAGAAGRTIPGGLACVAEGGRKARRALGAALVSLTKLDPGCFMIFRVLSFEKQLFLDAGPEFLCSSQAL